MVDRRLLLCSLAALQLTAIPAREARAEARSTQGEEEDAAIMATALDYIESWYAGDAARMERALHPELAKRILMPLANGTRRLEHMSAMTLVQKTRAGIGRSDPGPRAQVRVLDRYEGAACARIDASAWIDYLHLAKSGGRWRIVNVLWELRPKSQSARQP